MVNKLNVAIESRNIIRHLNLRCWTLEAKALYGLNLEVSR